MKNLNTLLWKAMGLKWHDESANERAYVLECKISNELTYEEIESIYSDGFCLKDDEGFSLTMGDIRDMI